MVVSEKKAAAAAEKVVAESAEVVTATKAAVVTKKKAAATLYSNDGPTIRRNAILGSLIFLGICIFYLVFFAPDDELRRGLGIPILGAFTTIILGYAGIKAWDDKDKRTKLMQADNAAPPAVE